MQSGSEQRRNDLYKASNGTFERQFVRAVLTI